MRVQQQNQSLRLRIDEAELARLLADDAVQNETCWPDGRIERQRLTLAEQLDWQRDDDGWCVTLPASEVHTLAARLPSRDGLSWEMPVSGKEALRILFDVDVRDSTRKRHGHRKHDA
ncbi:MAG TPA: hypothetical protein VFK31_05140 [Rhodanobacteraceae bacterium]|nr:hypothetical protein [Rhodanobacteraceae bacterium]